MGNSSSAAPSIATLSTTEFDEEFESFIRHAKQLLSPDVFGKVEGWLRGLKDDIDPGESTSYEVLSVSLRNPRRR